MSHAIWDKTERIERHEILNRGHKIALHDRFSFQMFRPRVLFVTRPPAGFQSTFRQKVFDLSASSRLIFPCSQLFTAFSVLVSSPSISSSSTVFPSSFRGMK